MGWVEAIEGGISRAIWKGVKHAGTAVAGIGSAVLLKYLHFPLSDEHQMAIAVFVTGALGTGLKMLKDKVPAFSWL